VHALKAAGIILTSQRIILSKGNFKKMIPISAIHERQNIWWVKTQEKLNAIKIPNKNKQTKMFYS